MSIRRVVPHKMGHLYQTALSRFSDHSGRGRGNIIKARDWEDWGEAVSSGYDRITMPLKLQRGWCQMGYEVRGQMDF